MDYKMYISGADPDQIVLTFESFCPQSSRVVYTSQQTIRIPVGKTGTWLLEKFGYSLFLVGK